MKIRSIALGLVTVGVLAVTAGCSSGTAAPANGKVTLDWIMWAGSDAETSAWQHVADLVHQKDPNITVKLKTAAWPDYWTKLPTVLAGNSLMPALSSRLSSGGNDVANAGTYPI